jgi:hypothetical protein
MFWETAVVAVYLFKPILIRRLNIVTDLFRELIGSASVSTAITQQ